MAPRKKKAVPAPPWAGAGEDPQAATVRLIAIAGAHRTHDETATALGVSARTVKRWWAWLKLNRPDLELPPRIEGGPAGGAGSRGGTSRTTEWRARKTGDVS